MEIDLDTLKELFERASVTSEIAQFVGHDFRIWVNVIDDELQIRIVDTDESYSKVVTISIPVKARTTFSF